MRKTALICGVAGALAGALLFAPATAQEPALPAVKSPLPGYADGRGPAGPVEISIASPKPGEVIPIPAEPAAGPGPGGAAAKGAEVSIRVELKGFELFRDEATRSGQHVHIVFDATRHFELFDVTKAFVLKNVAKGTHTVRVFPARPWHESLKGPGAFAMVTFHVGEKDGKNTPDPKAPLLTGNRPKGKYPKGEAHKVMLDFLVRGCVVGDKDVPDSCRVRYRIGELPEVTLTKEGPVWLTDLAPGKHPYVIALTKDGKIIEGPFNLYRGSFEIVDEAGSAPPAAPPAVSASPPKAGAPAP